MSPPLRLQRRPWRRHQQRRRMRFRRRRQLDPGHGSGMDTIKGSTRSTNAGGLNVALSRLPPSHAPARPPNASRPQTDNPDLRCPGDGDIGSRSFPLPLPFPLRRCFPFPLEDPLPLELRRRFLLQSKPSPPRSGGPLTPRRRTPPGAGQRMIAKLITVEHRVDPPSAALCATAVYRRYDFGLHANAKQRHPLVRGGQNPRIVPGQTTQILAVHAEIASSLDDVAPMPRQHNSGSLVAEMLQCGRPLRNMRHEISPTIAERVWF